MSDILLVPSGGKDTAAVQKAINDCAEAGGGTVAFASGEYELATVFLRSNVKILIPEGTVVYGASDFYDYCRDEEVDYPLYQDASHSFFHCSMFVGEGCENIAVTGGGKIDMRSVWDEDNIRNIVHRGAKCIALKNCKNVLIDGLGIDNATDLAVYFAGCENVEVGNLKMRVYIDGVSPDCSRNVFIHDCDIESGDDGIVFKSSYTLNRLEVCRDIRVENCRIKSRCNAIKFGTETNGGFFDIVLENIDIRDTRIAGIAIESVDGAKVDGITLRNIRMKNVATPLFIHLGDRLRGPEGSKIGSIENVLLENITAEGPYEPYECVAWNYITYVKGDFYQEPWNFGFAENRRQKQQNTAESDWQITSNVCGKPGYPLKNITLKNVSLLLDGGVKQFSEEVPEETQSYPEVYVYGDILPAKGIYFRHVDGLKIENLTVKTYRPDVREDIFLCDVTGFERKERE